MSNEKNVYVEPPIEVTVTEGAMGALSISTNNHNDLANRYTADQHNIDAITGLRARLLEIQNPTVAKSVNGRGYAEYYKWLGGAPSTDKTGYFVSLVQDEDGNLYITPVSTTHPNIFGVTIPISSAAFVGNDEWVEKADATGYESSIDETYGLVCLEGAVKVRYALPTLDIKPGDWVIPTSDGRAEKSASTNGCYLVAGVGVDTVGHYVEINLSLSASDVKKITVDHAILSDNAVNYTANGTIKRKFDEIEYEFDDIKDGTTVVGEASHSVSTDDYTENGTIKAKFDEVDQYVWDIEQGIIPVGRSLNASKDRHDHIIDKTYYSLYSIDSSNSNFIGKSNTLMFEQLKDLNKLCTPSQCGVYMIEWSAVKDVIGLPNDAVFPSDGASIKLIVEADYDNESLPAVWQTLKIRNEKKKHDNHLLMYHRVVVGIDNDEPIWSEWQRFVSAYELENGNVTVKNATNAENATNDQNGLSIVNNYYGFNGNNILLIESGNLDDYTEPGSYYIPYVSLRDKVVTGHPRTYINGGEDARLIVECYEGHIFQRIRFMSEYEGRFLEFTRVKPLNDDTKPFGEWIRYATESDIKDKVNIISPPTISDTAFTIEYPIGSLITISDPQGFVEWDKKWIGEIAFRSRDDGKYMKVNKINNVMALLHNDVEPSSTYLELVGTWMYCGTVSGVGGNLAHMIQRAE